MVLVSQLDMAKSGWVQAFFGFFLEGGEGEWKIEGARAEFYFFLLLGDGF